MTVGSHRIRRTCTTGRHRLGLAVAAVVGLCLAGPPAFGQALNACMIDEEPWGYAADSRRGVYADVFREIGKLTGLSISASPAPLARTLADVQSGECLFTITSWDAARSPSVTAGEVLATLVYGILPRRDVAISSYADLAHLTIATARGLLVGDPFDHDPGARKVGVYGYEQAIRMVEAGHADGAVGSIITLRRITARHGSAAQFGQPFVLSRVPLALQMNRDFAVTPAAKKIGHAVVQLRDSGRATAIIDRYFSAMNAD